MPGAALWVYKQLSARGGALHRAVKHADLLIAAAAEAADIALLHYDDDDDYDLIADVTGHPDALARTQGQELAALPRHPQPYQEGSWPAVGCRG